MGPWCADEPTTDDWNAIAERYAEPSAYVAVVDHSFVLRAACQRAHTMFGLDPSDVLGHSAIEVIHPADLERATVFTETSSHSGLRPPDVYRIRFNGLNSDTSEYRAFDVSGDNLNELGGVVVFTLRELSDRRRAEMLAIEQIEILESLGSGATLKRVSASSRTSPSVTSARRSV
ncbi:MAG: PAS domain-containing protein [Acidimicrobiales bacterium]